MTKKSEKNLQDKKKSIIFALGIAQDNSKVVFEICSATPCEKFKPKEAMSVREMLIRTERGQRLDVNTRFRAEGIPDNMYHMQYDEQGRIKPDKNEDTFDHTPPDGMNDIVDVIRYQEDLNERKEALKAKHKGKTSANADEPDPKNDPTKKPEPKPSEDQPNE